MGIFKLAEECILAMTEHARAATRASVAAEQYWEAGVRNTTVLEEVNATELARRRATFAEEENDRAELAKIREVTTEIRGLTNDMAGFRSVVDKAMQGSQELPK